jgi:hypothetical protein
MSQGVICCTPNQFLNMSQNPDNTDQLACHNIAVELKKIATYIEGGYLSFSEIVEQ